MICPIMSKLCEYTYQNGYNQNYQEYNLVDVECLKEKCAMWQSWTDYSEYSATGDGINGIRGVVHGKCGMIK